MDKTGLLSFESLKRIAIELGETMTDDELKLMILEANKSNKYFFFLFFCRFILFLFLFFLEKGLLLKNNSKKYSLEQLIYENL